MIRKAFMTLAAAGLFCALSCQAQAASTQSDFFREGSSAREFGLGNACVAMSSDLSATYCNPAGLGQQKQAQLQTSRSKLQFFDSDVDSFSASVPTAKGSVGLDYVTTSTDFPIPGLIGGVRPGFIGVGSERFTGLGLAYGHSLTPNILLGANVNFLRYSLLDQKKNGTGYGLSGMYKFDNKVNVGVNLQNIGGTKLGTDKVPFNFVLGASAVLGKTDALTLTTQYDSKYIGKSIFSAGAEYNITKEFSVRVGESDGNFAYGLGINLQNFRIDYALNSGADEVETNKFSFTYFFPGKSKK